MPDEKETKTKVGVGNTEVNRETRKTESDDSDRDRYRGDRDRYRDERYDDEADYRDRVRRDVRDLGDTARDAGREVRREGTDIISAGCDFISGFFIGIGEAISPRRRGGSSGGYGRCGQVPSCSGYGPKNDSGQWNEPPGSGGQWNEPPGAGGARYSRTEVRRTR